MSSRSWTVVILAPDRWLNSNQRRDRRRDAPTVKTWRDAANVYARAQKLPRLGRVAITATLHFPDRRRRDCPNYYPTIKAAIDGLVDADVLDDDADGYVTELTIRPGERVGVGVLTDSTVAHRHGALVLTIREVT